jgi:hypothetical protein
MAYGNSLIAAIETCTEMGVAMMRTIRVIRLLFAVFGTAILLATQACGGEAGTPAQQAPNKASDLTSAITKTRGVDFKVNVKAGDRSFTVAMSAESKAGTVAYATEAGKSTFITTADMLYMIGEFANREDKYVGLSVGRMQQRCAYAGVADPAVGLAFAAAASSVEQPNPTTFQGKFDLAKVSGDRNTMATTAYLTSFLAGDTTSIPFTATVKGGYVASFEATFAKARPDKTDLTYTMTLSGHGEANKVAVPPTDKVEAAPADMYVNE